MAKLTVCRNEASSLGAGVVLHQTTTSEDVMTKLQELREKRNATLRAAQAILVQATVSTEDRTKVDGMFAEADVMGQDIERLERVEAFEDEERKAAASRAGQRRGQPGEADKRKLAFTAFLRNGRMSEDLQTREIGALAGHSEQRDMLTSGAAGALIPQEFYPILIEAMKAYGGVISIVGKAPTDTGATMKIALENDTANGLVVVGEQGPLTETDIPYTPATSAVDEVSTGIIKISWAEMNDSKWNLDGIVRDRFGKRYGRGSASMVTVGNGSNVAGLTSITAGVTSAAPAAVAYADLVALYGALDPAYEGNANFVFNSTTRGYLLGIVDTLGRPIYIPNPSTGAFDRLFGRPVVINQAHPNIGAGNVAVQYGDFNAGYKFREVGGGNGAGLAIVRLNERYADILSTGFLGYARIGGFITDAGTHPILSLKQHA
jgi:HK97 family phage major capsid protein